MRYVMGCLMVLVASPALAQGGGGIEIGTSLGMTVEFPSGGNTSVSIGVPSGAFAGLGSMYMTVFAGQSWMIEPQVFLNYNSEAEEALFSGMLQIGYLFDPEAGTSPYVAVHGGFLHLGSDSDSPAFGGAVGVRNKIVGGAAAIRGELRYRAYPDESIDLNELAFSLGIGVVL